MLFMMFTYDLYYKKDYEESFMMSLQCAYI